MKYQQIADGIQGLKWLSPLQGKVLYDHICTNKVTNILELGFYHGVSTMYMAAALHEKNKDGSVVCIDKRKVQNLKPTIHELSKRVGLEKYIRPIYVDNCYTWALANLLEQDPRPMFDLIFIDGAHLWKTDALAFFLCDKLLNPDGWMIFDDLKWSMSKNANAQTDHWTKKFSNEEKNRRQVQMIFDLLVKEHPNYSDFREEIGFGFARKIRQDEIVPIKENSVVKQVLVTKEMLQKLRV